MSKKIVLTPECEVCDGLRDLVKTSAGYYCKEHQPMKIDQRRIPVLCGKCRILKVDNVPLTTSLCPLHAMAPELLEACRSILADLEAGPMMPDQCEMLRQVIAKATGD